MSLSAEHPQILDFIRIKEDQTKILNANLSVEISDRFMEAVKANKTYEVNDFGTTYTVDAPAIYTAICESAMRSAEPGIIFTERFRNYNLMQHVDAYQIVTSNPCGTVVVCRSKIG